MISRLSSEQQALREAGWEYMGWRRAYLMPEYPSWHRLPVIRYFKYLLRSKGLHEDYLAGHAPDRDYNEWVLIGIRYGYTSHKWKGSQS